MLTRDYQKYLSVFLWLIGIHSLLVGIGLLIIPSSFFVLFGFPDNQDNFFQAQGGAFHIAMSIAYCMAALYKEKPRQLIRFIVYVKLLAFIFLISYFIYVLQSWLILFSGVADGFMGAMVFILFRMIETRSDEIGRKIVWKTEPFTKSAWQKRFDKDRPFSLHISDNIISHDKAGIDYHLPGLILTGASGLIGKNLLDELKNDYRIFAIARRSQQECNAPRHSNIAWIRADISNLNSITKAFREIRTAGGADYMIHLAAYYDFTNEYHPEYKLTNIDGTKYILNLAKEMNLKFFLFASSVAACSFPSPASEDDKGYIDEDSAPDGWHIYARSKRVGEEMVKEFAKHTPSYIFRLGAVFTDWCEYPPLYNFLNTWCGKSWKAKILAGKGGSAIPYIHIREVILFLKQLLKNYHLLVPGQILIASTNGSTSHLQLFKLSTRYYFGEEKKPLLLPKFICAFGIYITSIVKRFLNMEVFEQPWMIKYIDKQLNVRLKKTPGLLNWNPAWGLSIEKRFPFLIERMKSEPLAWQMRNIMIMRKTAARVDFHIYSVLLDKEDEIIENIVTNISAAEEIKVFKHLQGIELPEFKWFVKLIYRLLLTSINSNNKLLIQNYFEASGINRFQSGYELEEIIFLLKKINNEIILFLKKVENLKMYGKEFYDFITLPIEFGIDEAELQYNSFKEKTSEEIIKEKEIITEEEKSARQILEETIWNCLVHRK